MQNHQLTVFQKLNTGEWSLISQSKQGGSVLCRYRYQTFSHFQDSLLSEQKQIMAQLYEERRALAEERTEFTIQQRLWMEKKEKETVLMMQVGCFCNFSWSKNDEPSKTLLTLTDSLLFYECNTQFEYKYQ
jgi:hypothetical protein